jgi:hypothetical protein
MVCDHLSTVEKALLARGIPVTFRGQAWSDNCREWVYFDCYLDLPTLRGVYPLDTCVQDHAHRGTHDGQEAGLVCSACHDAIMGHVAPKPGKQVFRGL